MKKPLFILIGTVFFFTSCQEIKKEVDEFVKEADEAIDLLNSKSDYGTYDDFSKTTYGSNHDNPLNKRNNE